MGKEGRGERDVHHRTPRSKGGNNKPWNLSDVDRNEHRAWHRLFHNFGPITIAAIINETWIPFDWRFIAAPAEGFLALWQLANWFQALRANKRQNMDGDGI